MDILDDMGVSKLSAKAFLNYFFKSPDSLFPRACVHSEHQCFFSGTRNLDRCGQGGNLGKDEFLFFRAGSENVSVKVEAYH